MNRVSLDNLITFSRTRDKNATIDPRGDPRRDEIKASWDEALALAQTSRLRFAMAGERGSERIPINDWPLRNNSFNEPIMPEDEKNERSFAVLGCKQRTGGWRRKETNAKETRGTLLANLVIEWYIPPLMLGECFAENRKSPRGNGPGLNSFPIRIYVLEQSVQSVSKKLRSFVEDFVSLADFFEINVCLSRSMNSYKFSFVFKLVCF